MATMTTARSESVLHYLNPIAMAGNLWRHRDLIRQFTRREIEGRYKGSFLGLFWSFINPLVLLLIYTFVFGIVFQSRWPTAKTGNLSEFAVTLFCGITAFNIFSECIGRAAGIVVGVPNYVKKVVFPLEILPVSTLGAALFHAGVSLAILLIANLLISGALPWTLVFLPVVILPLIFLSLGLTWFLSSLGVFIRDIGYTVTLIVQVLFFLTPLFYAVESIPEPYRSIIQLNPLTSIIENIRLAVLWGDVPDAGATSLSILVMLLVGSMAAFGMLIGKGRANKAFAGLLLLAFLVPGQATLIPIYQLFVKAHLVDSLNGLIAIYSCGSIFCYFLILGYMKTIPAEMLEAARIDGAGPWRIFRSLVLPLIRPILVTVGVFQTMWVWNDFITPNVFISSPEKQTLVLQVYTAVGAFTTDWPAFMTLSVIVLIPMVLFFVFMQRHIVSGLMSGAVKG